MSLPITDAMLVALQNTTKKPQLILEIDGLPSFSSTQVKKYPIYGDPDLYYGKNGLLYGGLIADDSVLPWIDLSKSSNSINQQLQPDKGGFSSVQNFDVTVIDKDGRVSEMIKPNNLVPDVLSRKAKLYLSLDGAGHPHDSILFFTGIVTGCPVGAGFVKFNLSSPEKLKNLEIFPKVSTEITSPVGSGDSTINVSSTADFLLQSTDGTLTTYLIINDEIIKYTGKTSTTFTGCARGQFGTVAASHSASDNVESAYRIQGNLKELCLKLMLSGVNNEYFTDGTVLGFNYYAGDTYSNAVIINDVRFKENTGVVIGDTITVSGAANGANNGAAIITDIQNTETYTYLTLNKTLINEVDGATFTLTSQFSVLPKFAGLEMTPDQVDVQEFIDKYAQFSASFFEYDFFIKDSVKGSDFINEQILFPSGCYSLPRKAKTSLGITAPPISGAEVKTISASNVSNASSLVIERSINQNFYNSVVYKYDLSQIDDKYKRGTIIQSANSTNRIQIANKPLTIQADGVRSTGFSAKVAILSKKILSRYQYAAESIEVDVLFGEAFSIEIGDAVIFKGDELKVSDLNTGDRNFRPRLMEVQNKTVNLSGKSIRLKLVDTQFGLQARYGVISPSSKLDAGSTATVLRLKKSYGTNLTFRSEQYKYSQILGAKLRIRSADFSFSEERYLLKLDPDNEDGIILSSALSLAPSENYIVEVAPYSSSTSQDVEALTKLLYVNLNATIQCVNGISNTVFEIDSGDLSKIKVGATVYIHNSDYTDLSPEVQVIDITGSTITVDADLGFAPDSSYFMELNSYPDNGYAYRLF